MYEKEIFSFVIPMTNITAWGYSVFKEHITQITVYYKDGNPMTEAEADTEAEAYIERLTVTQQETR